MNNPSPPANAKPVAASVLLSGGIDSAACAYLMRKQGYDVSGLFVDYGQVGNVREREAACAVARVLSMDVDCPEG